jgi:NhaA family Na+:H+ antiporter
MPLEDPRRTGPYRRSTPILRLTAPLRRFLRIEAASGGVLLACTLIALLLANSPWAGAFHDFWRTHLRIGAGGWTLDEPLHFWIGDLLMAVFFFVVGLEIKREIVAGELSSPRKAALPVVAALGGMLAPAAIYLAFNHDGPARRGWGVPMATDIAFVVGVLAAFGPRVPLGLKIFLLSLAIADDMGAVLVIAVAYTEQLNLLMLALAAAGVALIVLMNRSGIRAVSLYVAVGGLIWLAVYKAGIHPTVAGVLLGLLTPAKPWLNRETLKLALTEVSGQLDDSPSAIELSPGDVAILRYASREAVAPLQRLLDRLHPWVGFAIMPLFALANAGVPVQVSALGDPVALAVAAGLALGKPLGVLLFCFVAVKLKLTKLPDGVGWGLMTGGACLAGIGFTMALFVNGLAFPGDQFAGMATAGKVGTLLGSVVSATLGAVILMVAVAAKRKASVPA